ncbi:hypothetical protein BpHYR1_046089 [Brachionus plicatilis]|uniref:Uncharacterized protein n=1 Tax=Brachionus plicatilis TaxID=10195 RepID=A0A3M7Q7J4_BRAPC|nr:hypothetical protein BpHYR1_046089 [Brachionus plicatilis]
MVKSQSHEKLVLIISHVNATYWVRLKKVTNLPLFLLKRQSLSIPSILFFGTNKAFTLFLSEYLAKFLYV